MSLKSNIALKVVVSFVLAIGFIAVVFIFFGRKETGTVCFGEKCFFVELARTPETRQRGLMFRKELGQDQGMLFIYDQEKELPFWMKNTLISLDIIWIDQEQRVVFINENAQPCQKDPCPVISSGQKARYVWEIPGGRARAIGLKVGDQLELKY